MELDITDADADGWTVVVASGEVDVATAPRLRSRLADRIDRGDVRLVLGLDGVTFIDSTGLGVLIGMTRTARAAGGEVRIVCTEPRLLRVFAMTGLDRVLPICADLVGAVGAGVVAED